VNSNIGKVSVDGTSYWVFPNSVLTAKGREMDNSVLALALDHLRKEFVMPQPLPTIHMTSQQRTHDQLVHLSKCLQHVYIGSSAHVLHILASVLKAIHFDTLMEKEKFVSILNVSGPANVGKTLACAIALKLMESPGLMLSRCTMSSMLDYAHVFKNMLIVWDDPRNVSHGQLSSIVHEAFNGIASGTITKGRRQYNSALVIGTQQPMLGMEYTDNNVATFTRLSHVHFKTNADSKFNFEREKDLQNSLNQICGTVRFFIENTDYDKAVVDDIYEKMSVHDKIIGRALRVAAIDKFFMMQMAKLMNWDEVSVDAYFKETYIPFLKTSCSRVTPFQQFLMDVAHLFENNVDIPSTFFKSRVIIDLKDHGPTECFALYSKSFFEFLARYFDSLAYTKESIHHHVKTSKIGEVSRNVSYKSGNAVIIRRSIVIRRIHLEKVLKY